MIYYIGLGSNLGDRAQNLSQAKTLISQKARIIKKASYYENPAWIPEETQQDWNFPFLNTVIALDSSSEPESLLRDLKQIEKDMGRKQEARWAPRIIDIDILFSTEVEFESESLKIPHQGLLQRPFVLAPLCEIAGQETLNGKSFLQWNRQLKQSLPLWMGIVNVTPDSFSDGGLIHSEELFLNQLKDFTENHINILDIGAESTRPGARAVDEKEEWEILKPYLEIYRNFKSVCKPQISVDTRHAYVAERAIEYGVDYINDVSGLGDDRMFSLLKKSNTSFIFMHSLTVPADPEVYLATDADPVESVRDWLLKKLDQFDKSGVNLERLTFDPGIGFGKTAFQSLELIRRWSEFDEIPVRTLIGHSRKSFMKNFSHKEASQRDWESVGMSLSLAQKKVDILRVHNPVAHLRTFRGWSHGL